MFLLLINYSFLSFVLLAGAPDIYVKSELTNSNKSYLSLSYANFIRENPGGIKKILSEEKKAHISISKGLTDVGYQFYKLKEDKKAVKKYEEALSHYATDRLYYHYGNSLSNIERLNDAIKAYKISLYLGNKNKGRVYYNIACAYSRLKDEERSLENLDNAIINGYNNFNYINIDKDLIFLRSQKSWKEWITEREKLFRVNIPSDGLVAEYLFNGNAEDNSGNENHGTLIGNASVDNVLKIGDNIEDYMTVPNSVFDGLSNLTISFFIKFNKIHREGRIPGHAIISCSRGTEDNAFLIFYDYDKKAWDFWVEDRRLNFPLDTTIFDKKCHSLIFLRNGADGTLYIDGIAQNTRVSDIVLNIGEGGVIIGQEQDFVSETLHLEEDQSLAGEIDNLRIYNRALSNKEIQALYNESL